MAAMKVLRDDELTGIGCVPRGERLSLQIDASLLASPRTVATIDNRALEHGRRLAQTVRFDVLNYRLFYREMSYALVYSLWTPDSFEKEGK